MSAGVITKKDKPIRTIYLGLSPKAAEKVKTALVIEVEGPRSDDLSKDEIEILEKVIAEITSQETA